MLETGVAILFGFLLGAVSGYLIARKKLLTASPVLPVLASIGRYRVVLHFERGRDARKVYEAASKAEFFQDDICRARKAPKEST